EELSARPTDQGVLGGRELGAVKEEYEKYLQRSQAIESTIKQIKDLSMGGQLAMGLEISLKVSKKRVDAATDTGDVSVVASAYKELEAVNTEATETLKSRIAELKQIATDRQKFKTELGTVQNQADANKKKQQAERLR